MGLFDSLKADWTKSKAAWKAGQAKIAAAKSEMVAKPASSNHPGRAPSQRSLNIVGESFSNAGGQSRHVEIKHYREGEPVTLRAEPDNEFSDQAIAVFSCRNVQLGYIGAEHCEWIARLMQRPEFKAQIQCITGGERGKPSRGIVLLIGPC